MPEVTSYPEGMFCWADMGTTDQAAAREFYVDLFGWEIEDNPIGDGHTYTTFSSGGKPVCGLYPMREGQLKAGAPPAWLSYISVHDVDAVAERAASLGSTLMSPPFDVMDSGRMTLLQDPTGALVALWQPKLHHGASLINEPVSICWNELATRDTSGAEKFYADLLWWRPETQDVGGQQYTVFNLAGEQVGGMYPMGEEFPPSVPPYWGVHFAVEDCDATVENAEDLGATVLVEPMDVPTVGRFATLQDPQEAAFAVVGMETG